MRIRELLKKEGIALGVKVDSKDAAIDYLIDLHAKSGNITDKAEFKKGILAREESGSTGVGEGIAIPHSKNAAVKQPGLAAMTVPDGVDYDSLDGQPANLFFMIAAPEKGADVHLEVLSRLSMLLMDENFRAELLAAKNADQFLDICSKYEMEKFADELGEATEDKKEKPIMWLQSLDEQALALPIIKPEYIVDEYAPDVEDELVYKLGENVKSDDLMIFVTMTVPSDLTKMTCNLKAPIIINTATMKAVQAVAANEDYVVRFPVYNLLKERKEKAGE